MPNVAGMLCLSSRGRKKRCFRVGKPRRQPIRRRSRPGGPGDRTVMLASSLGHALTRIDLECESPEAEQELSALLGELVPVVPTYMANRGKHRLFRWAAGLPDKACFHHGHIEIRVGNGGLGTQSVAPPSIHPKGLV